MKLSDQHKAAILTGLISGTVLMLLFGFHINQHSEKLAESYYVMEPKTVEELEAEAIEKLAAEQSDKAETNKAFNETKKYKSFAQAYQPIAPPKDYEYTKQEAPAEQSTSQNSGTGSSSEIDEDVLSSYNEANAILKQQQGNIAAQSVNKKSTMHYSLVDRTHKYLPTPIYLCETGGKVVVNITVNYKGIVIKSTINSSASADNNCLQEHALDYANQSRFSIDNSKPTQLGSITFYFEGKR
ncbi:hypothetical protein [Bizionia myxarmorum]|uniref:Energy transducer TonB n=1 Tax=Bizionia myxarmorum TaxID=291186 RepID=A0A5D0RDK5_9FLAO|nr:hypothetical protein [Bizionia myxarmorum]TYB79001.1 hypothetical protein ES674_04280 [Bizionia myxarmorum]